MVVIDFERAADSTLKEATVEKQPPKLTYQRRKKKKGSGAIQEAEMTEIQQGFEVDVETAGVGVETGIENVVGEECETEMAAASEEMESGVGDEVFEMETTGVGEDEAVLGNMAATGIAGGEGELESEYVNKMVVERTSRPDNGKRPVTGNDGGKKKKWKLVKAALANQEPEATQPDVPPQELLDPILDEEATETPGAANRPKNPRKKVPPLIDPPVEGQPYDASRFIDSTAATYYLRMAERDVILDRGFSEQELKNPYLKEAIESRGWNKFAKHCAGTYSWELTRIFTANAHLSKDGYVSWVNGVEVPYGPRVINEFYSMVPVPEDVDPFEFITTDENKERNKVLILEAMFEKQPGGVLYYKDSRDRVTGPSMATPHYQWLLFYRSKISPKDHFSAPNATDLLIVYFIKVGRPVDIGSLIAYELKLKTKESRNKLIFPCLIWQLCEMAGVDMSRFPPELKMRPPFSLKAKILPGVPSAPLQIPPDSDVPAQSGHSTRPSRSRATQASAQSTRSRCEAATTQEATSSSNSALEMHRLREDIADLRKINEEMDRVHREEMKLNREKMERLNARMAVMEGMNRQILSILTDNWEEQNVIPLTDVPEAARNEGDTENNDAETAMAVRVRMMSEERVIVLGM